MAEAVRSKAKCPKCGSKGLLLIELWKGHEIVWEQINGKFTSRDGILNPGDPYKVECQCSKCKHQWRVRGAIQIRSLIDYVQEEKI